MEQVWCQPWLESERGWGQRDDGYSIHLNEADIQTFHKQHIKGWPAETPDVYDRPVGQPYLAWVDAKTYAAVRKSRMGIRSYSNVLPKKVAQQLSH